VTDTLVVFGESVVGRAILDVASSPLSEVISGTGGHVVGLVLGPDQTSVLAMAGLGGISEAIGLLHRGHGEPSAVAECIVNVAHERQTPLVILPAGVWWNDVACRVAAALHVDPLLNCTRSGVNQNGYLYLSRSVLDNSVLETREFSDAMCVATLRPVSRRRRIGEARRQATVSSWIEPRGLGQGMGMRVSEVSVGEPLSVAVGDADVVVAGGRGVGSAEGFQTLVSLASLLGGTIGGSRIAVDRRWVPRERQIGQTGHTVCPRLYIACGISGASHHVLGMKDSEAIVAINTDPQAPVFRIADMGVVVDCNECLPALVKELRSRKESENLGSRAC